MLAVRGGLINSELIEYLAKLASMTDGRTDRLCHSICRTMGHCMVGLVGHGPPNILVGWATMHFDHPIIRLYVR